MARRGLGATLLLVAIAFLVANSISQEKPEFNPAIAQVWALEDDYWRYVRTGDVESYVKLWHQDFVGWPCSMSRPTGKARIGDWVREVRDKKLKVEAELTREAAQQFGDVVVVHYSFTRVDTYPDGRVEGRGKRDKITHTWQRAGNTWLIIGGMCGSLQPAAAP